MFVDGITWNYVDVGAAPKHVALAPFGCLAEEPDGAVTTLEIFGQVDRIGQGRRIAVDKHGVVLASRQVQNGLLRLVQHLDPITSTVRVAQVPRDVECRSS